MRCCDVVLKQKDTIFKFNRKQFNSKGLIKNYYEISLFSDNLIFYFNVWSWMN